MELNKTSECVVVDREDIKLILRIFFFACYTEAQLVWPAVTAHTCNPSTLEAKAGKPSIQSQPRLIRYYLKQTPSPQIKHIYLYVCIVVY